MEENIIVNEKDEIIGYKPRYLLKNEDLIRVSVLWLRNSLGEFLIAKRSIMKNNNPGKWGPAVAGCLEKGETYETAIIREAFEEIGINLENLKEGIKIKIEEKHKFFLQWFIAEIDLNIGDFKLQKEEVYELKWIKKEDFLCDYTKNPGKYLKNMKMYVENFER